jgi:four helix bundle protein
MIKNQSSKQYDLEDRTFAFAKQVVSLVNSVQKTISNIEISKQLIRSAGSVGANYIEANEALGKKDFVFRIKICRKEAKESRYWLRLIEITDQSHTKRRDLLVQEAHELTKIFGSIVEKSK